MKKWIAPIIVFVVVGITVVSGGYSLGNRYISSHWTSVYKAELDRFFGEGNWECVDKQTERSKVYQENVKDGHRLTRYRGKVSLSYQKWDLRFHAASVGEALWTIDNLTLKVNQNKYYVFSKKRYSNKQALTMELMDIAEGLASEEVYREVIQSELPEKEAACIRVGISYTGGNPKPEFYSNLIKEEWFTVDGVSAAKFLECKEHDFYIDILALDYRAEKLTEEERQHIYDSLEPMAEKLLDKYGEYASFDIRLGDEARVSYVDGRKQQ